MTNDSCGMRNPISRYMTYDLWCFINTVLLPLKLLIMKLFFIICSSNKITYDIYDF